MSNNKPKPRKRREDKLDWEELEKAPNVDGMYSYLRPGPKPPTPVIDISRGPQTSESQPSSSLAIDTQYSYPQTSYPPATPVVPAATSLPQGAQVTSTAAAKTQPVVSQGSESLPTFLDTSGTVGSLRPAAFSHARESQQPQPSAWLPRYTPTTVIAGVGKRRLHRCTLVQDAHTPGEQVILNTLYRLARNPRWGRTQPDGTAIVSVSLKELGEHARMHETNVRVNVRNLLEKLAIELVTKEDRRAQTARGYRVFTFRQILERRRQAGLEWVVKGRGITFVPTSLALETLASDSLDSIDDFGPESLAGGSLSELPSDSLLSPPSDSQSLPILEKSNHIGSNRGTDTSSYSNHHAAVPKLIHVLRSYGFEPDQELLIRMTDSIHTKAMESTGKPAEMDDILHFVEQKLKVIQSANGVRNPLGLLASIVPKCFEGESYSTYRQERERELLREQERLLKEQAELDQWRSEQEAVLNDPNANQEEKAWARHCLGIQE